MLANLLLQLFGWMVLIGAFYALIDRLGRFRRSDQIGEETLTRLWRESARMGGEESRPGPNRSF